MMAIQRVLGMARDHPCPLREAREMVTRRRPPGMDAGPRRNYLSGRSGALSMDTTPAPFIPPAPKPRTSPPSFLEMIRIVYRNPLELWGEPSYNEPWISAGG